MRAAGRVPEAALGWRAEHEPGAPKPWGQVQAERPWT